jgi:predicted NAD-dependent protein-ADP-ribosyltransferase YbiA (DUF1768 family)
MEPGQSEQSKQSGQEGIVNKLAKAIFPEAPKKAPDAADAPADAPKAEDKKEEADSKEPKAEAKPNANAKPSPNTKSIINIISTTLSPKLDVKESEEESEAEQQIENIEETEVKEPLAAREPEVAQKKARKLREIKPTDSKTFFKARAKDVSRFPFTAEGDLRVPSIGGEEAKIITLPFYSPATTDELEAVDSKRKEDIHQVEQEYDELCKQLSTAIDEWKSSGDYIDAIRLQKELLALDSRRTSLRSPLRWGKVIKNPTIKKVQLHETAVVDEKQKDLKLGYEVMTLVGRPYTFEQTVLPRKEKPKVEVAVESVETTEQTFVLFDRPEDPEYGLLSPETPLEFVFNTTKYNSIMQAYHVERVTQVGRTDMRAALLKLVNPKSIRGIGSRIVGKEAKEVEAPFNLIKDIVKTVVLQDARYASLLRKTGTDTLIYAEPQDKILGVGMSIDDEAAATNSSKWNGALNLLGKAWEEVRKTLPPEEETVQKGGAYLESGRTVQDVKQARSKVLMGYYRRK